MAGMGQHRRRATKFMVKRNREQEVAEYQAQFEDQDGKGRLKEEKEMKNG
ncbi:hypothetical protein [Neisseria mucosa]|nr:hypothetical protein [Neisseria mucosa]